MAPSSHPLPLNTYSSKSDQGMVAIPTPAAYKTAEPSATDVLVGRGKRIQQHPGNIRFRRKIDEFFEQYRSYERGQKQGIVSLVLDWLASSGGRIVKPDRLGYWVEVDKECAKNKVALAFRHKKLTLQNLLRMSSSPSPHSRTQQNPLPLPSTLHQLSALQPKSFRVPFVPSGHPQATSCFWIQQSPSVTHTIFQPSAALPMISQQPSQPEVKHNGLLNSNNSSNISKGNPAQPTNQGPGIPPSVLLDPIPLVFPQQSQQTGMGHNKGQYLNCRFQGAPLVVSSPTLSETGTNAGIHARESTYLAGETQALSVKQSPDDEILREVSEWEQPALKAQGVLDCSIDTKDNGVSEEYDEDNDDIFLRLLTESSDKYPFQDEDQPLLYDV